MIHISDKSCCCGCTACVAVCPKRCIRMVEDSEGCLYPQVDLSLCIDCGLCKTVCPVLQPGVRREPSTVYAAKNADGQIRLHSSSGGIFTLLAEYVIKEGGVVFGARFNKDWEVVHDYAESREGLAAFRGSKYVQSRMGDCFRQAKQFLQEGRKVLFSGTPCQIAGLKNSLRKDYDNLLTVDVICHGVPVPLVWRKYLAEIVARQGDGKNSVLLHPKSPAQKSIGDVISRIDFRDKELGWKKYSFALTLSKATAAGEKNTVLLSHIFSEDAFMKAFLSNISLRPSCYACPAKSGKSGSDITLGDFWGVERVLPEFDDDKGVSVVLGFTEKGKQLLEAVLPYERLSVDYATAIACNPFMLVSVNHPRCRDFFLHRLLKQGCSFDRALDDALEMRPLKRARRLLFYWLGY